MSHQLALALRRVHQKKRARITMRALALGDVDSNHDLRIQSPLFCR
jgi:hypothetical protein